MPASIFNWCPFLALLIGALSTLAFFRSRNWGLASFCVTWLAQVLGWTLIFLAINVQQHGWTVAWNTALWAGFLAPLTSVTPYAVIGAAVGGVLVTLVRISVREEVEQVRESAGFDRHFRRRAPRAR
jgi:hypothetical protein